jgi:hypothetical protein
MLHLNGNVFRTLCQLAQAPTQLWVRRRRRRLA